MGFGQLAVLLFEGCSFGLSSVLLCLLGPRLEGRVLLFEQTQL